MKSLHQRWLFIATTALCLFACKKDEPTATNPGNQTNLEVNNWILKNMREVYYWNDKIPANPDKNLAPKDFFNSLVYRFDNTARPDGDRFSFINENAEALKASLSGEQKTTGAEYTLSRVQQGSDDIIAQVLYVQPGSPAAQAGIKRGDIFYQVNNQQLTVNNYMSLLFGSATSFAFGVATYENNQLQKTSEVKNVTAQVIQENPILLDSIYTKNDRVIGYLVYNQFIPGPNGSKNPTYDQQVDNIFAAFKAAGVNELILDLRYNPGGYVSSSVNLASLIGKGVDASKVFYRQEWNPTLTPLLRKDYGDDFFVENFVTKAENIGNNLQQVYVLTSGRTASASELIINSLRPYMPVIIIGTTTTGKNVGSITSSDNTKKIQWGLQPIVFKSFNSLNQSDYTAGFTPTAEVREPINLKPLGDVNEALLNEALVRITGGAIMGRRGATTTPLQSVGSSLDRKAGGGNMFDTRLQ